MGERLHLPIPMWVVQCQLLGGPVRLCLIALFCAFGLAVGFFAFTFATPTDPYSVVAGNVLLAMPSILGFILILGGCGAVYRSLLRDHTSNMRDSHRLTPMSSTAVILGYVFGATFQITTVAVVVMAFGGVMTVLSGGALGSWLGGTALMLHGAVTLWCVTVFFGMRRDKPISPGGIIIGVSLIANAGLVFVPALGVFMGVYAVLLGGSVAIGAGIGTTGAALTVMIVHFVLTAFWIDAAAAKYRRPDLPALQAGRGMVLVVMVTLFGMAGVLIFDNLGAGPAGRGTDRDLLSFQWCATMGISLMTAVVPVAGSLECRRLAAQGTAMRSSFDRVPSLVVAIVGAAIVVILMGTIGRSAWIPLLIFNIEGSSTSSLFAWLLTTIACFSFVLTARGLLCLCRVRFRSFRLVTLLLLLCLWVLIPAADLTLEASRQVRYYDPLVTSLALGQSPLGTIVLLWTEVEGPVVAGVIGHVSVTVVVTLLSLLPRFRRTPQPPQEVPEPAH